MSALVVAVSAVCYFIKLSYWRDDWPGTSISIAASQGPARLYTGRKKKKRNVTLRTSLRTLVFWTEKRRPMLLSVFPHCLILKRHQIIPGWVSLPPLATVSWLGIISVSCSKLTGVYASAAERHEKQLPDRPVMDEPCLLPAAEWISLLFCVAFMAAGLRVEKRPNYMILYA